MPTQGEEEEEEDYEQQQRNGTIIDRQLFESNSSRHSILESKKKASPKTSIMASLDVSLCLVISHDRIFSCCVSKLRDELSKDEDVFSRKKNKITSFRLTLDNCSIFPVEKGESYEHVNLSDIP